MLADGREIIDSGDVICLVLPDGFDLLQPLGVNLAGQLNPFVHFFILRLQEGAYAQHYHQDNDKLCFHRYPN